MSTKKQEQENVLICGLGQAEIDQLKLEYGFLILGTVKQGGDTYHAIFKEPTLAVMKAVKKVEEKDKLQSSVNLFNNCVVAQDEAFEGRDYLKIQAAGSIAKHLQSFSVETKNL